MADSPVHVCSFDNSVGRAVDCSIEAIHRPLVRIRLFSSVSQSFLLWDGRNKTFILCLLVFDRLFRDPDYDKLLAEKGIVY